MVAPGLPSHLFWGKRMNDFEIGKEIGEIKHRLDALERRVGESTSILNPPSPDPHETNEPNLRRPHGRDLPDPHPLLDGIRPGHPGPDPAGNSFEGLGISQIHDFAAGMLAMQNLVARNDPGSGAAADRGGSTGTDHGQGSGASKDGGKFDNMSLEDKLEALAKALRDGQAPGQGPTLREHIDATIKGLIDRAGGGNPSK